MVRSLLKFLIVVGLGVAAWELLSPRLGRPSRPAASSDTAGASGEVGTPDAAWECVHRAEQASLDLSALTGSFRPGASVARDQLQSGRDLLTGAREECRCLELPCDLARQALDQLDEVLTAYERMGAGDSAGYSNPATYRERAVTLLERARGLSLK